ncbi:MAG TPA: hypothetical protein VIY52_06820 [Streptosporangiaceae bacterium]
MPPVTRAKNPEEDLSIDESRISLRVKVPAEDGTAVVEMTGPAVPENGLQAFGDWVLAALEQHADRQARTGRRLARVTVCARCAHWYHSPKHCLPLMFGALGGVTLDTHIKARQTAPPFAADVGPDALGDVTHSNR